MARFRITVSRLTAGVARAFAATAKVAWEVAFGTAAVTCAECRIRRLSAALPWGVAFGSSAFSAVVVPFCCASSAGLIVVHGIFFTMAVYAATPDVVIAFSDGHAAFGAA